MADMRIGGLASGIDTDKIVKDLMAAERIPLDKMQQDRIGMEWKRDAFRDVNKLLLELDNMSFEMRREATYTSKAVTSSMEGAVTATASASATEGSYKMNVTQLASSAMNVGGEVTGFTLNTDAAIAFGGATSVTFQTAVKDENGNIIQPTAISEPPKEEEKDIITVHHYAFETGDTVQDVLDRINADKTNNVRMTFDTNTSKLIMETTRTGDYVPGAVEVVSEVPTVPATDPPTTETVTDSVPENAEIQFDSSKGFFAAFNMDQAEESGGTDAEFTYNDGYETSSKDNNYSLNGVSFQFNDVTNGNASLTVTNDVDAAAEKIMAYIEKYNEVVEVFNGSQQEEVHRDFPPLTDEQRNEMSDNEIELWEEKAKSGLLRGESVITNGMFDMRQSWYGTVETGGAFTSLTQIGIETSSDYLSGGKLEINEEELKKALTEDPESVKALFMQDGEGNQQGLIRRVEEAVQDTKSSIEDRAGKGTDTLENYTLGKRIKEMEDRISSFEDRLVQTEDRYWRQFSAMEQAISRLNQQSSMLMSNFGGGQ